MLGATSSCMSNNPDHSCHCYFHGKHEDFAGTELWKKARDELNEFPEKREQDIQYLRDLLKSREPNLTFDLSDSFLMKFLRVRKFDSERAFKLICQYYQAQVNYPCIYEEYWPSSITEVLKAGVITVLPDTDRKGRAIIIIRFSRWDPSEIDGDDVLRCLLLTIEAVLQEEHFQINGAVFVMDWGEFSLSHFTVLTPRFVYRAANTVQFHVLGQDLHALQNFIEEHVLPADLGGTNNDASKAKEEWYNYMHSLEDTFRENCTKYGYNQMTLHESACVSTKLTKTAAMTGNDSERTLKVCWLKISSALPIGTTELKPSHPQYSRHRNGPSKNYVPSVNWTLPVSLSGPSCTQQN